ncbi:extracellular solute-binding protein [Paenibacillus hemerocallicola]|uniref:Extracellular solute-binding protein n=1 Tax=Paenibacillus hemerocallicola TaxID=1172614 RepID=A0A5C4T4F2_9BACL|nr:extracellular solute-binding protein [Paenibacillus hemerocallicola]TNJ63951.1 extracellular solute-binding protein [Paenibacillus hemerocallicola]
MKKLLNGFLIFWFIMIFLPGCGGAEEKEETTAKIKVMYDSEGSFLTDYGELFMTKHPGIDFEVVSLSEQFASGKNPRQAFEAVLQQAPDIMMLDIDQFTKYAAEGYLYELSPLIHRDGFDLEGMAPAVIRLLNLSGGGKLYGLSPTFTSSVLYYNTDLFDKHGIPYPTNGMSWNDVLQLAQRFPDDGEGERRIYGLQLPAVSSPYYFAMGIGRTQGLDLIDPVNGKITAATSAWKDILHTVIAANSPKANIYRPKLPQGGNVSNLYRNDAFFNGRAAMVIRGIDMMNELKKAKDVHDIETPNWDIAMPPADPHDPDVNVDISVQRIFAINSKSPNVNEAWKLLKYIHSDEYAKVKSRSERLFLLTRTGYSSTMYGRNLDMLYNATPSSDASRNITDQLPASFIQPFIQLAGREIEAAVNSSKTAEAALQTIQDQGQMLWDNAKLEEKHQKTAVQQP